MLENKDEINKLIDERTNQAIERFMKQTGFSLRKVTDTPTDNNAVVPRKYVNLYGSIAGRPQVSVVGQQYFATDLGYPIFRNSNNAWVSGTGSVVG